MSVNVVKYNRETVASYRVGLAVTIDRVGDGWEPHELKEKGVLRESAIEIPQTQISNFEHLGNALGATLVIDLQAALTEELRRIAPPKAKIVDPVTGEAVPS